MKKKQYAFVQLFKLFIKQSRNGSRLQKNGGVLKMETIDNYSHVLKRLIRYDALTGMPLRIKPIAMLTQHQLLIGINTRNNFILILLVICTSRVAMITMWALPLNASAAVLILLRMIYASQSAIFTTAFMLYTKKCLS